MSVVITPVSYPPFVFDAVTSESHEHTNEPTDFPVEEGVNIVDHIRIKPDVYTVTGLVSQTPSFPIPGSITAPLPLDVQPYQAPFFQSLESAASALFGPPPPPVVTATQVLGEPDYLSDAHGYFLAVQQLAVLCDIESSTHDYTDMVITTLSVNKSEKGKIEITVAFKKITTVTTATVAAPVPTIPAGASKVSTGSQGTTTPTSTEMKATVLKTLTGLVGL